MQEYYNINIDEMRYEIQSRQYARNEDGSFKRDSNGRYINNLTLQREDGSSIMQDLLWEVLKYRQ
jgi:hypothetical protein